MALLTRNVLELKVSMKKLQSCRALKALQAGRVLWTVDMSRQSMSDKDL